MMSAHRSIVYLSPPLSVNMGDWWFDVATNDHFWIRRRFEVMRRLADSRLRSSPKVAEIGCGNGLVQRDVEGSYKIAVTGFDLNELALKQNVSRLSPLYYYDIHQRNTEFRGQFDLLILFDVLEHINDQSSFLQAVKFHLAPSGSLLVNVPAHQFFYSDYDRAAGHIRRYSDRQLLSIAEQNGLNARTITYWGLPLVPLLLLRKGLSMRQNNGRAGFDSRNRLLNALLSWTAKSEPIPQRFLGTSIMAEFVNAV